MISKQGDDMNKTQALTLLESLEAVTADNKDIETIRGICIYWLRNYPTQEECDVAESVLMLIYARNG